MNRIKLAWQKDSLSLILKVVCIISVCTAFYSILTYGQTFIHSDTATATLLAKSILKNRDLFPRTWNYANGDIWTLGTHLTTLFPSVLLENQSLARVIGSLIWVVVAMVSIVLLGKVAFKSDFWVITIPILFVFIFELGDMVLYQAAYTGSIKGMALSTLFLSVILWGDRRKKHYKVCLVLYFLSSMIGMIGGIRGLAEGTIPVFFAFVICEYSNIRNEKNVNWKAFWKKLVYGGCVISVPVAIGFALNRILSATRNVNYTVNSDTVYCGSLQDCWNNFVTAIANYLNCFGFYENVELISIHGLQNLISIVICVMTCLVVPILQARKIKDESMPVKFFFAFCIVHNCIMMILVVFFGKTTDRYLLTSVFACVLMSSRYIYEYWIKSNDNRKIVWTGLFVITVLIECIGMVQLSDGWKSKVSEKKEFCAQLERLGVKKGYATYWNAYTNEIYSDCNLRFGAVNIGEGSISPYYWLVDSSAFYHENGGSFLLLSAEEKEVFERGTFDFRKEPISVTRLGDRFVYLFDYDLVDVFPNGIADGIASPNELFVTDGGTKKKDSIELATGDIVFGPYVSMTAGIYAITYHGRGLLSVFPTPTANAGKDAISYRFTDCTDNHITIELYLDSDMDNVEYTAINRGDSVAVITGITVKKK